MIVENLKTLLANTYALALKTQNYHWNVTGANFKTLHLLFEEQYDDLSLAVDAIAERIRALGEKAPGSFKIYDKLSIIKDANENASSSQMLKELAEDQTIILDILKKVIALAQDKKDEVTTDLAIQRMAIHEKASWMLKSSI